jgi:hypothetical protein
MEAATYLKNDQRVSLWSQLWENAISEVERSDKADRFPDFGLQMRPDSAIV